MTQIHRRGVVVLLVVFMCVMTRGSVSAGRAEPQSVEDAVLAVSAEMTRAGEALDADRLFSYILESDKGSVIQNGVVMVTRGEALEQVRSGLRRVSGVHYRWNRQYVTVLSPEVAILTAEGEATATTPAGDSLTNPLAQTIVFVLKNGNWKAIHAHQSSPQRR